MGIFKDSGFKYLEVRIKKVFMAGEWSEVLPVYKTKGSAGCDLRAAIGNPSYIPGHGSGKYGTGIALEIPEGFEAQVRPRSSLSDCGILCPIGTIDSDYRGEIHVLLFNLRSVDFRINPGDRIAQLVFSPVVHAGWQLREYLHPTRRGGGGFGSTGR